MKIELTVTYEGGEEKTVRARPVTIVAFERQYKTSVTAAFAEDSASFEHLAWLAWHASRVHSSFDDWLETIDSVEGAGESGDPTQPVPSAD